MNKKFLILPLLSLVLVNSSCSGSIITANLGNSNDKIDASTLVNLPAAFAKNYEFNAIVDSTLLGGYNYVVRSDDTHYHSEIYFDEVLTTYSSLLADANGFAYEQYLGIDNEIHERLLVDSESAALNYEDLITPIFSKFGAIKAKDYENYFEVYANATGYRVDFNDVAISLLGNNLDYFFFDLDPYAWDPATVANNYKDVYMILDENQNITKLSFVKIKTDKFGGYKEHYSINVTEINDYIGLSPLPSIMNEEDETEFSTNLNNFYSNIKLGNFTQNLEIIGTPYKYQNYYDFTTDENVFPGLMISNLAIADPTYGDTFLGVLKIDDVTYKPYGFSPWSGNAQPLLGETYPNLDHFLPNLTNISPSFFKLLSSSNLLGTTYRFDFRNFPYLDYDFGNGILRSIFGRFDPLDIFGNYFYYNNAAGTYTFNYLDVKMDSKGKVTNITLNFDEESSTFNLVTSFSNIGTTDLQKEETIAPAIDFINDVLLGGN